MFDPITISGAQLGQKQALFPDWQLPYAEAWQTTSITLRALIAQVVQAELAAYQERQAARQTVRALTAGQITAGAARGKIDSGGREIQPENNVDVETAVAAALEAFEDGLYFVFVDGRQLEILDAPLQLTPGSAVSFVRLVALAGG
jgi:hypothetical protein